jgi:hypothetical protein
VHGLWHQPAHFDRLAEDLRRLGANVHAPRLHRGSLGADTAVVQETVDGCLVPPVVLGHSYGGSVITGLERVRHLMYVAAFVPAAGESGAILGGPSALVNDAIGTTTTGLPAFSRNGLAKFCTQIAPPSTVPGPPHSSYLNNPVTVAAYPAALLGKPSRAPIFAVSRTERLTQSFRNEWPPDVPKLSV